MLRAYCTGHPGGRDQGQGANQDPNNKSWFQLFPVINSAKCVSSIKINIKKKNVFSKYGHPFHRFSPKQGFSLALLHSYLCMNKKIAAGEKWTNNRNYAKKTKQKEAYGKLRYK